MPSCFFSLLLATSLGVLQTAAAPQAHVAAPGQAQSKVQVQTSVPESTAKARASKRKPRPAAPASPAGKARRGSTAKAAPPSTRAGKADAADCDTPAARTAAVKPVPVAADPLAPTLAPCAEPARKP